MQVIKGRLFHLPAGHSKVVRVKVRGSDVTGDTYLFEPVVWHVKHQELLMPDALVGVGGNGEATLVIANTGTQPVLLQEGDIIGRALQELDLDIQYCPGKTNSGEDALSRHPVPLQPDDCTKRQTQALVAFIEAPLSSAQSRERDSDRISLSGAEPPSGSGPPDSTAAAEKGSEGIEQISGVRGPAAGQDGEFTDGRASQIWKGRLCSRHSRSRTIDTQSGEM